MGNSEIKYGTDGHPPSLARGLAKRLGRDIQYLWKYNRSHTTKPTFTQSRKKNYQLNIKYLKKLFDGLIIDITEYDFAKTKDRKCVFTVIGPKEGSDDFTFVVLIIPYRDPRHVDGHQANINISKHCLERLYQRYAGTENTLVVEQLKSILDIASGVDAIPRYYEIGTGAGMCIAATDKKSDGQMEMTLITWVDKEKLAPEQPYNVGNYRIIESPT